MGRVRGKVEKEGRERGKVESGRKEEHYRVSG